MMDLILLQAAPGNDGFYNLIFPLAMLAVVIFIFYSQFKRNKDQRNLQRAWKKARKWSRPVVFWARSPKLKARSLHWRLVRKPT
jgi:hypothetical protein